VSRHDLVVLRKSYKGCHPPCASAWQLRMPQLSLLPGNVIDKVEF
jgi:hypothetical protein